MLQAVLILPAIFLGNISALSAHMQREAFRGAYFMEDVMRLWRTTRHENGVQLAASSRRVSLCLCYKHRWKAIA